MPVALTSASGDPNLFDGSRDEFAARILDTVLILLQQLLNFFFFFRLRFLQMTTQKEQKKK